MVPCLICQAATLALKTHSATIEARRAGSEKLPRKKKKTVFTRQKVVTEATVTLPEQVTNVLQQGPKFCQEPVLFPVERLAQARRISHRVPEDVRLRCTQECVQVFSSAPVRPRNSKGLKPVVDYLTSSHLCLLESDKEGSFVVIPEVSYVDKARAALQKNFVAAPDKCSKE
ncbi:hypothetical protein HPB52_022576 [Rhipicephalus sanguineus]|uniref:Uncharacterized protein n=1 Tax=Rhipicephalus sanguineus TaxID=34632 RepID=A0A9D4PG47_RHISA|nr:hypothetical protein HPB52_022576 [Rhipicephalus sanguineus]